jgi:hypothetical protein
VPFRPRSWSGSHCPRMRRANEPEPCASAIRARWPWSARCASLSIRSPDSPIGVSAPRSPASSPPPTPPRRWTYDLRRLRGKGLIQRLSRSNTYVLTPDGTRVAIFYTKVYGRLLRPLLAADHPPAQTHLRQALRVIDAHITSSINHARVPLAT